MIFYQEQELRNFRTTDFAYLAVEVESRILRIKLNRPEKRNAMTPVMMNEIAFAIEYAAINDDIYVVELSANGPVFCAGADLKAFAGEVAEKDSKIPLPNQPVKLGDVFKHLYKPCIAKIHADVFAGGFLLLGGCSHVICSENAKFALPEINRGIWPFQVMASLAPLLKKRDLLDLCMRGKVYNAKEAKQIGLVSDVVTDTDLTQTVEKLIIELSEKAPLAMRKGFEAYENMLNLSEQEKHTYLQSMLNELLKSEDAKEGIQAFAEKRKPVWRGQ